MILISACVDALWLGHKVTKKKIWKSCNIAQILRLRPHLGKQMTSSQLYGFVIIVSLANFKCALINLNIALGIKRVMTHPSKKNYHNEPIYCVGAHVRACVRALGSDFHTGFHHPSLDPSNSWPHLHSPPNINLRERETERERDQESESEQAGAR